MHVTISIINYNYGRYLREAINSALVQKAKGVTTDILVIDDGSTDDSDQIIASYSHISNFSCSKTENRGFAFALTRAVREAKGDFVLLMDADDFFADHKLSTIVPFLQQGFLYVADTSTYVNERSEKIKGEAWGSTSTIAVNRSAALPILPVENELSFFLLYKIGKGISLPDHCTNYRFHHHSMTSRNIPGKQNTYLSTVALNLSDSVLNLLKQGNKLPWEVTPGRVRRAAYEFRSQSHYNKLEAALETKCTRSSYKHFLLMVYWQLRSQQIITIFHLKMLVKTIIQKPSFDQIVK